MTIWHFIFAIIIGALCTVIFTWRLRKNKASAIVWIFLFIITIIAFFSVLTIGKFGPTFHGIHWLPFLLVGLLLIITTSSIVIRNRILNEKKEVKNIEKNIEVDEKL
ncbi:hypothetical protein GF312_09120 [Candidatus Poribacteria bacterium]|nr:hypothetical protein [Candidatus Poribacteria bacterium]